VLAENKKVEAALTIVIARLIREIHSAEDGGVWVGTAGETTYTCTLSVTREFQIA